MTKSEKQAYVKLHALLMSKQIIDFKIRMSKGFNVRLCQYQDKIFYRTGEGYHKNDLLHAVNNAWQELNETKFDVMNGALDRMKDEINSKMVLN